MRKKLTIAGVIIGIVLIAIGVYLGVMNSFEGGNTLLMLGLGGVTLAVTALSTSNLSSYTGEIIDMITLFFMRP